MSKWNKVFDHIYFSDPMEGFIPTDKLCHKTIRKNLQSLLDEMNTALRKCGEEVQVDKVVVTKQEDKWRVRFISDSLDVS